MTPAALLDSSRRGSLCWLAACSIGQAAGAVIVALALGRAIGDGLSVATTCWMAFGGLLTAGAMLGERWAGEVLAQSLVSELRLRLFDRLVASKGVTNEAQWLNPLVGDLSAIRNWAARGPVRLATAALALSATLLLFAMQLPYLALSGLPLGLAIVLFLPIGCRLADVIRKQRLARGSMTRFIVRRARVEASGQIRGNRHGRQSMRRRSGELAKLATRRARYFGLLEALAACGSAAAAITLAAVATRLSVAPADVTAAATLIGFMSSRLLEIARASHAAIGGHIAFARITIVLSGDDENQTASPSHHKNRIGNDV
jgi:ABC-type multidrug transport system fused ATPase/permease subunit